MDLHDKIKKIEALLARAKTEGERQAAELARGRILGKLQGLFAPREVEYTVALGNHWKKKLFVAICAKHGLRTYRYKKQKHTTAMVRVAKSFMNEIVWPEFKKYAAILEELVQEVTDDLISRIHKGEEEEIVIAGEIGASEEQIIS